MAKNRLKSSEIPSTDRMKGDTKNGGCIYIHAHCRLTKEEKPDARDGSLVRPPPPGFRNKDIRGGL